MWEAFRLTDLSQVDAARRFFDPTGHYNRPDIFQLSVDTRRRKAVTLVIDPADGAN